MVIARPEPLDWSSLSVPVAESSRGGLVPPNLESGLASRRRSPSNGPRQYRQPCKWRQCDAQWCVPSTFVGGTASRPCVRYVTECGANDDRWRSGAARSIFVWRSTRRWRPRRLSIRRRCLFGSSLPKDAINLADIGAAFFGETPPYQPLIDGGLARLFAFEPDERQIGRLREYLGGRGQVIPQSDGRP
jgi:hypothetical protein